MLDPIGVVFQLKDRASGQIGKLQHRFEQLHGTSDRVTKAFNAHAKRMGQGMSLMVGGAVGGNMLRGLANDATTFEAALTKMASAARAGGPEVQQLSDKALELGVKFEFSPDETIMGMKALASAGLNVRQILTSVPSALQLASAAAGEISIPQAAETLTAAMKGYGMAAENSG
ncbi:MAG: phage tail tape measure protein, partial [Myxococcota bacterium]